MLLKIMSYLAYIYAFSWFIWPFVFVYSFASGIAGKISGNKESDKALLWAGVALLFITSAIIAN